MKLKLHRDHVVSIVKGKNLVGVYVKMPNFDIEQIGGVSKLVSKEFLLAEFSPEKADAIIAMWNNTK